MQLTPEQQKASDEWRCSSASFWPTTITTHQVHRMNTNFYWSRNWRWQMLHHKDDLWTEKKNVKRNLTRVLDQSFYSVEAACEQNTRTETAHFHPLKHTVHRHQNCAGNQGLYRHHPVIHSCITHSSEQNCISSVFVLKHILRFIT